MLFTIIIPSFNANELLTRMLSSIPDNFDDVLEIIVVDDGSTIAQQSFCCNKKIKFFRMKQNMGQSSARNFGLDKSNGKYILFCDADDYLITDEFTKFIKYVQVNKLNVDLIRVGFIQKIYGKKRNMHLGLKNNRKFNNLNKYLAYCFINKKYTTITPCTHIYNKNLLSKHRFEEGKLNSEDLEHFFRITEHVKSIYITNFNFYYNENDNKESTTNKYQKQVLKNQEYIYKKYVNCCKNKYLLMILCTFYWLIFFKKTRIYVKCYITKTIVTILKLPYILLFSALG